VVERAGTAGQRVCRGELADLATMPVSAPATIVIGPVAALDLTPSSRQEERPAAVLR
jgi:siroheme synthase